MKDPLFFNQLVTKSLQPILGNDRFFEGYLTIEMKDKQGEVTIVDELIKVLPIWMDRGAPITDTHSNRVIGKGINYQKTIYKAADGQEYPAIKIIGKIHSNYELDTEIWSRIKSGEYKGLSFGGATKSNRTPFRMKDGSIAYSLKDLEHYEVAVCKDPAVPLALITDFNPLAKAITDGEERADGKMLIKCSKWGCYVDKAMKDDDDDDDNDDEEEKEVKEENEVRDTDNDTLAGKDAITNKADSDTFIPPQEVANEAKMALQWISEGKAGDGFTGVGRGRAEQLASRKPISLETLNRMVSFFARHTVDRKAEGFESGEKNYPSGGRVAHNAWGGFSGETWAKKITESVSKDAITNKADLGSISTFQGKVDALVKEGTPLENAKKIVGAYIKREKKASNLPKLLGTRGLGSDPEEQNEDSTQISEIITKRRVKIASYKSATNYINSLVKVLYKDMVEESDRKNSFEEEDDDEEEDQDDETESKEEVKDTKKSFRNAIKSNFEVMTDVIQSLAETQKSVSSTLSDISERLKALETPTNFALQPKSSDKEDIGADVKVPDKYQSNSIQASLDDDGEGHMKDQGKLSMQEKTFTTATPRPNASLSGINKSLSKEYNPILKDARSTGDLSAVGRDILAGKYYTPPEEEAWF